ncbi:MAG: hypothetical protein F4164_05435 [Gemmatimonadales bacterium]|nr:hypothetical protein [Gemmatimonadales bacterium]
MGFDVIGLITVVLAIIGVGVKLELGNRKLGGRVDKLGNELRSEIGDVRREMRDTRAELRGEIRDVRDKLGNEIAAVRGEIKDVRDKLGNEIAAVRGEIKDMRDKLGNEIAAVRGEIKDVRDKLGNEIGALRGELAKTSTSVARLEGHAFGIPFPDTGGGRGVGQG